MVSPDRSQLTSVGLGLISITVPTDCRSSSIYERDRAVMMTRISLAFDRWEGVKNGHYYSFSSSRVDRVSDYVATSSHNEAP